MADMDAGNATVLVVDDLPENTVLLQRFLAPRGYEVRCETSGAAALEAIKDAPPDIILLDLVMPGIDGYEVCRRVKESPASWHIPIITITGMGDGEANVKAVEAGADDFVAKPFDPALLSARIESCLRVKRLQDKVLRYQERLEQYSKSLEQRINERSTQLLRTQQVAIFSLAKLAESRDTETGEHLERMRAYTRELAEELSTKPRYRNVISPEYADALFHSTPLHDIGKVGIPDRILLKPGKLTEYEFEVMKSHTLIGGDTLEAADREAGTNSFLAMGCDIAYYHHERWDGKGYPSARRETEIPLSARIVALADVYDALASKRPYKEAMPHEKCRAIILEGRGGHFDPDVVDAFLAREQQFIAVLEAKTDYGRKARILEVADDLSTHEGPEAACGA